MDMSARSYHSIAITSNIFAALCVATLLGLGIYVNMQVLVVEGFSIPGFSVVQVDQSGWNIGCTVVGTAVGILVSVALSSHDDFLTRKAILSEQGVVALYLKPLTAGRGAEQVRRGELQPTRVLLVFLTIVATLSSAATVAIFGIHNAEQLVFNPAASYPLAGLNGTYFFSLADGSVYPLVPTVELPVLDNFLYRSAYIGASMARGSYSPYGYDKENWISESGAVGDTTYGTLNTEGIGLNTTSYVEFSGLPSGFNMPSAYTFNWLNGDVFGTHIDVECVNATGLYTVNYTSPIDGVSVYLIRNEKGFRLNLVQDTSGLNHLMIGSAITNSSGSPLLTIVVPNWIEETAFVCECTYSGREFIASVELNSRVSPLVTVAEVLDGPYIGSYVKWTLANYVYGALSKPGGGTLVSAWLDAEFNTDGDNNTDTAALLGFHLQSNGRSIYQLVKAKHRDSESI